MAVTARVDFLGVAFDMATIDQVVAWLGSRDPAQAFAYVVTPNVDHLVRLEAEPQDGAVRRAYRAADLCLCDSRILQRLARWKGVRLTLVPGSDLTTHLFDHVVRAGDRICLIGGDAELAAAMRARSPGTAIVQHIPPMGFRADAGAMAAAAEFIAASRARFVLLAVGSPQQELLGHRVATDARASGIGLCIGASIEFLIGRKARAPRWMQRAGIEWLHRLLSEPRRLWRRYLIEGPHIFAMTLRWRRPG